MAGGIIWFAVVVFIVIRSLNSAKKNNGQAKPNAPRRPEQPGRRREPQKNPGTPGQAAGKWTAPQMQPARPAQKTGSAPQQYRTQQKAKRSVQENSILKKAKANAEQQFAEDTLAARGSADLNQVPSGEAIMKDKAQARHIHSEHENNHDVELRNQLGVDDFDTYHLIDEVNDLIVKGYSGNLQFERDFLSEAADMLNRMYG